MMIVARVLFMLVALSAASGMGVYLWRRLVRDVTEDRRLRLAGGAVMGVLFLAVPFIRFLMPRDGVLAWLALGVSSWWGLAIYLLLSLLTLDLGLWLAARLGVELPGRAKAAAAVPEAATPAKASAEPTARSQSPAPEASVDEGRRRFLSRAMATGAVVSSGGLVGVGASYALLPPEISEVPVRLPGMPKALEGFTIVQLSDIHVGPLIRERMVNQLVEVANRAKGDLVAITGDLVDGSPAQLGDTVARFTNLRSRLGTFFVSGNHDYYAGWERWHPVLEGLGFTVLRNRWLTIGDPGASFDLVGVDDFGSKWMSGGYDLDAAVQGRDPHRPSVLLAHQPRGVEEAAAHGIGLQLSGHTHGGQLFPGNLVGQILWGSRNAGLSKTDETLCYTSRGCGFVGPPVRVGAPPEVVKLILLPA